MASVPDERSEMPTLIAVGRPGTAGVVYEVFVQDAVVGQRRRLLGEEHPGAGRAAA